MDPLKVYENPTTVCVIFKYSTSILIALFNCTLSQQFFFIFTFRVMFKSLAIQKVSLKGDLSDLNCKINNFLMENA